MVPLILVIALVEDVLATPQSILLDVSFKNVSEKSVRILKYFNDEQNLPIWFQFRIVTLDDTPLTGVPGGGKIGFRRPLEYIDLGPHEVFSLRLNVAKFANQIHEGTYKVSITYRNQYGKDCFHGELVSNTVKVTIMPNRP